MVDVVLTPGSAATKSRVLRVESGALLIMAVVRVEVTAADCAWTISVEPVTTTVSCNWPTSRTTFLMDEATPTVTVTSGSRIVLNPIRETVTVYCPGASAGIRNLPSCRSPPG